MTGRKLDDEIAVLNYERIGNANDSAAAFMRPHVKRASDLGLARAAARGPRVAMRSKQKFL